MSVATLERKKVPQALRVEREASDEPVARIGDATLATRYRESLRAYLAGDKSDGSRYVSAAYAYLFDRIESTA